MSTLRSAGVAANQATVFLRLWRDLSPHVRTDRNFPNRLQQRLARERAFGSRDRRLYRELLYTAVRYLPWIEQAGDEETVARVAHFAAETPATHAFRSVHARPPAAAPAHNREELLPAWLRAECPAAFEPAQLDALLARAPLWLRLQADESAPIAAELAKRGWTYAPSSVLPHAWRLDGDVDVTKTDAYSHGLIEIQDLGSQLILESLGLSPSSSEHWLDACAGAGGKTLQLVRLLGPAGRVTAHDIRPAALAELQTRAARAGLAARIAVAAKPHGEYDAVLVDAPCSGSGTWRRAPHLKWSTTPADIAAHAALQRDLLARYSRHVRPGGRLVYATCSLCRSENDAIVASFLAAHPGFEAAPLAHAFGFSLSAGGLAILPARYDTDGFFVAHLHRRA
ncbi:MAG TPA: RsmB/NOP family class I SAM-dependent RNA methyltransferase [Opitutaceae bacterium]